MLSWAGEPNPRYALGVQICEVADQRGLKDFLSANFGLFAVNCARFALWLCFVPSVLQAASPNNLRTPNAGVSRMASRLFAPASSERVDNSVSEVRERDTADNEPTKRRSSSLVGDLAASILGANVLSARRAPPPFPDAEDASDGTRYFFAGGGRSAKISSHGTLSPALVAVALMDRK